jgi:hypothetical protein
MDDTVPHAAFGVNVVRRQASCDAAGVGSTVGSALGPEGAGDGLGRFSRLGRAALPD